MANTKHNTTVIEWPSTGHFTIEELQAKYPSMVNITLRFRIQKALNNNEISKVGKIKPAIGRPCLVFVKGPATKEVLEAVFKTGVLPLKENTLEVGVTEVKAEKKATKPSAPAPVTQPAPATV